MAYLGIVESGSTKSDWIFINAKGEKCHEFSTHGLNPLVLTSSKIQEFILNNHIPEFLKTEKTFIHFYGAGCGTEKAKETIQIALKSIFQNSEIQVDTDLMAACRVVYEKEPVLVGILGTGSNICYFDGIEIMQKNPSLGFILADEGSGNHIGKELLKSYFYEQFSPSLSNLFAQNFDIRKEIVLENVYKNPKPNQYLAQFTKFAYEHQESVEIKNLIKKCFQEFVNVHVLPFSKSNFSKLNLVGSVAFYFREIFAETAIENNIQLGKIIQKPLDGLINFHIKNKKIDL